LLDGLSTLPPVAVYAVLALLAAVENIVPPVPADMAVALGAFLTHRGVTTLPGVFAVTFTANVLGAAGVYFAARRFGRRFFRSGAGRRLLAPGSIAAMEREYLRFGVIGIFFARLLPGIRAVVAPFAGIANLSTARALIPIAVASALWYGAITLLGAAIGAEWERIATVLGNVNKTLGLIALAGLAVGLYVYWKKRKRRPGRRVWGAFRRAIGSATAEEGPAGEDTSMRSAAILLLELAYADEALTAGERSEVVAHLRARWGLHASKAAPAGSDAGAERSRFDAYRARIVERFAHERRLALVERLWQVAFAEGPRPDIRDRLARRAGELLGLSPEEVDEVERRVRSSDR
jgi:membrane protein DedA with SNARE-associated domain/uncharacterized tellurite resistance protein B-like protein